MHDFLLIGWVREHRGVSGLVSTNLVPSSTGSTRSAWSHHPPPGWEVLVSEEQLKNMH